MSNAIKFISTANNQNLTDDEKNNARLNIGVDVDQSSIEINEDGQFKVVSISDEDIEELFAEIMAEAYTVYGFHVNGTESNPSNVVTYLEDAIGMTPAGMNYSTGQFDYGTWTNAFFMPKPCMLKYDGTVDYYLDPNDYTKKEDGTPSDVTSTLYEGNAMMEFGQDGKQIWYKIVPDENNATSYSVYIADGPVDNDYKAWSFIGQDGNLKEHFYVNIYEGYVNDNKMRSLSGYAPTAYMTAVTEVDTAQANGSGWNTNVFADFEIINLLLVLIGKSLDTQTVFGQGYSNASNTSPLNTGTMNTKGLFYGDNVGLTGVKVFGIENYWGNFFKRFAGIIEDAGTIYTKMCLGTSDDTTTPTYNMYGTGYKALTRATTSGYITSMDASTGHLVPISTIESESTYYTDYFWDSTANFRYPLNSGHWASHSFCGAFCLCFLYDYSLANEAICAALSYKPI